MSSRDKVATVSMSPISASRLQLRDKIWPAAGFKVAELSHGDCTVIAEHPLDDSLGHLHAALRKAEQLHDTAYDNSGQGLQKTALTLLGALLLSTAAFYLNSRLGDRNVASDLLRLREHVQKGDLNYEKYRALVQLVIAQAPDVDIWSAVFSLIVSFSRQTPPASISASREGTPVRHCSASQQGSEQTRALVDPRVLEEISDCTYVDVGQFFEKYFDGKSWTDEGKEIYNKLKNDMPNGPLANFPKIPEEAKVFKWIADFQEDYLKDTRGVYFCSKGRGQFIGAEADRQLDIFIKPRRENSPGKHQWRDVRVVAEHKSTTPTPTNGVWLEKLKQMGTFIRDLFFVQPTRWFVHGFTLLGTTMELWVFDRSGPYSSGPFDIYTEPEKFVRALAGYAMMSDEEWGLDTFIQQKGEDRSITITDDITAKEITIPLEPKPFVIQRAIVCRGTTCHRSLDSGCVAKFSWTSDKRPPESKLLKLARERGVRGVARLVGYHCMTSIKEMRSGLAFSNLRRFRGIEANGSASPSASRSQPPQGSSQMLQRSSETGRPTLGRANHSKSNSTSQLSREVLRESENAQGTNGQLANGVESHVPFSPPVPPFRQPRRILKGTGQPEPSETRHFRSNSTSKLYQVPQAERTQATKRKPVDDGAISHKRSKSDSPVSRSTQATQATSLHSPTNDDSFNNRRFCCLVISPAGRAIRDFRSITELLTALRDAIKAHRSLYIDGKILHRDISENNLIITDPEKADGFSGMLIDLDLAKEVDNKGRSGARHQTGTMEFMAIEVLRRGPHTYRHDLESFFYVLLWMCGRRVWEREFRCRKGHQPNTGLFTKWYTGTFNEIARAKEGNMMLVHQFEEILVEFPRSFDFVKNLCREIRGILFPYQDRLLIGSPSDPEQLYTPLLEAFDKAIPEIAREEGVLV